MNKFLKISLIFGLVFSSLLPAQTTHAQGTGKDIIIQVQGQRIVSDSDPFIENDRVLVPVRFISNALGHQTDWNNAEKKTTILGSGQGELVLYNNVRTYYLNGQERHADVSPRIMNSRTYVPLRLVAESFNLDVRDSYPNSRTIVIDLDRKEVFSEPICPAFPEEAPDEVNQDVVDTGTAIMGTSQANAKQMGDFLLSKNPNPKINCSAYELAEHFIREGEKEGIRGDFAFCQAIKETGYFRYGGSVIPAQNNYAGIGTTGGGVAGAYFESPQLGVRAQIQHLKAYATCNDLNLDQVDPRYHLVNKGCATNLEDLNGKWAVPGHGYGQSIYRIYEDMMAY